MTAKTQSDRDAKRRSSRWLPQYTQGLVRRYAEKGMLAHDIAHELSLNVEGVRRCLANFVPESEADGDGKNISHRGIVKTCRRRLFSNRLGSHGRES